MPRQETLTSTPNPYPYPNPNFDPDLDLNPDPDPNPTPYPHQAERTKAEQARTMCTSLRQERDAATDRRKELWRKEQQLGDAQDTAPIAAVRAHYQNTRRALAEKKEKSERFQEIEP